MQLKLNVVELLGRYITLDNRRIMCLYEHQTHVGRDVHFRANVYRLPVQFGLLLEHPVAREFRVPAQV